MHSLDALYLADVEGRVKRKPLLLLQAALCIMFCTPASAVALRTQNGSLWLVAVVSVGLSGGYRTDCCYTRILRKKYYLQVERMKNNKVITYLLHGGCGSGAG